MSVIPLYRKYLRQIRMLPHIYLRQFFRLKATDDLRAIVRTHNSALRGTKLKRVCKDVRKLEAANQGNASSFMHLLDLAYGRKGKLKRELLEPLISYSSTSLPSLRNASIQKSHPPVCSPALSALLISPYSRTTKALKPSNIQKPPTLPERTNPDSDDAAMLGPFSKRREVNIRWRYFTTECKKILPPLRIVENQRMDSQFVAKPSERYGQELGPQTFRDVEDLIGPVWKIRPLTRRERLTSIVPSIPRSYHPSRWLRRRYQQLLGRLPELSLTDVEPKVNPSVKLSPCAIHPALRLLPNRLPEATVDDLQWLKQSNSNKA
ncbi:hypothetical protein AMATHDRAFT_72589 [Amanita thiersii Skay4041]|uniref:LYR motif-containing protein Cup1-like N-terminal domain-containing protein n=1 Tax=Amanita thiersii Skay4041 TaxID=703135 RepID=A0A2A9NW75_9AGAR|nr:hypothetical protein AMATHDRAFT_72589 [Amanita thiersii Skay4041]